MLDLTQISREINLNTWAIAKIIRTEQDAGDEAATEIIRTYEAAINGNATAEQILTQLYDKWRNAHADVVAPIAKELAHPVPGDGAGAGAALSPFAIAPNPGAAGAATAVPPGSEPQTHTQTAPAPATAPKTSNGEKRSRRAWAQSDIVTLTRALLSAKDQNAALAALAHTFKRPLDEVQAKAVELELIAAPPAVARYELDDADKAALNAALRKVVPDDLPDEVKIVQFRFIATEAREIVKALTG